MYPYIRFIKEMVLARQAPKLGMFDTHVSQHICWPGDIDPWMELNNGRALTLYDLGRVPLGVRTGLGKVLVANGWGMAVAGNTTRYRKRVRLFQRVTMYSRCLGWDGRFIYMEQSMWRHGECTSQQLVRAAFTSAQGIVAPARIAEALGADPVSPDLPAWVKAWIAGDSERPWPPQIPPKV